MKIELITKEQYDQLIMIQIGFSILTFNNNGYEYIDKSKFTDEDKEAFNTVISILKDHIVGFSSFSNFRDMGKGIQLRFQYNWGAEDDSSYDKMIMYDSKEADTEAINWTWVELMDAPERKDKRYLYFRIER